ncbi:MAG: RNA 2',3'-cyclic phosphodiesterase [Chloroflexi bacterium]|nr:MAG: RNA 2',3'-cyclic phosphodiesterase [Chloroflexota bacterium]
MADIRSFIAIELAEELLSGLMKVQDELRADEWTDEVRWVRPEGIHLTLKFLGNVPAVRIEAIGDGVARAVAGIRPFTVTAEGLGVFPNWRRPRVIWVGVGGDTDQLLALQERVEQAMAELGFEPEGRRFHPHLTLGRVNQRAGAGYQRRLGEALQAHSVEMVGQMLVDRVSLMRSQLHPKGAVYTQLGVYPLDMG